MAESNVDQIYTTVNSVTNADVSKDLSTTDPKRHAILLINNPDDEPRKMNLTMNRMVKMYIDQATEY